MGGASPYEKLTGNKPELRRFRSFEYAAFNLLLTELRKSKLSEQSKECIFLRYVHDNGKIWRLGLWDPQSSHVVEASDVMFDELQVLGTRDENEEEVEILRPCISEEIPPEEDLEVVCPPGVLSSM